MKPDFPAAAGQPLRPETSAPAPRLGDQPLLEGRARSEAEIAAALIGRLLETSSYRPLEVRYPDPRPLSPRQLNEMRALCIANGEIGRLALFTAHARLCRGLQLLYRDSAVRRSREAELQHALLRELNAWDGD